jgi:hypothetical protein
VQASPLYSFLPHTTRSSRSQVPLSSDLSPSTVHHLRSRRRARVRIKQDINLDKGSAAGLKWGSPDAYSICACKLP